MWFSREYSKIQDKYKGKVVAVKDKKVIAYAESVEELLEELERAGEDPSSLLMEAVPPEDAPYIL